MDATCCTQGLSKKKQHFDVSEMFQACGSCKALGMNQIQIMQKMSASNSWHTCRRPGQWGSTGRTAGC